MKRRVLVEVDDRAPLSEADKANLMRRILAEVERPAPPPADIAEFLEAARQHAGEVFGIQPGAVLNITLRDRRTGQSATFTIPADEPVKKK